MRACILTLAACCCAAQISDSVLGYVRDRAGELRPVRGVAGAFVSGDAIVRGVLAASSSGPVALAKTASEVLVLRSGEIVERFPAPQGLASFGHKQSGDPDWVRFADETCLVWEHGSASQRPCPADNPPVIPAHLTLPDPIVSVERMGDGWLAVHTEAAIFAIHTEPGREAVYRLPERER